LQEEGKEISSVIGAIKKIGRGDGTKKVGSHKGREGGETPKGEKDGGEVLQGFWGDQPQFSKTGNVENLWVRMN